MNELIPFNEARFDACMAYMAKKHGQALTQYAMMKLHVLTDVFHAMVHGVPVIGGAIEAWQHGPVVQPAYDRVNAWAYLFNESKVQPEMFDIVSQHGKKNYFLPKVQVDEEDFSQSELDAMNRALETVMPMDWEESQDYFHKNSFIGKVWQEARTSGNGLDWSRIVDAFADENPNVERAALKTVMQY